MSNPCTCDLGMAPLKSIKKFSTQKETPKNVKKDGVFAISSIDDVGDMLAGGDYNGCNVGGPKALFDNIMSQLTVGLWPAPQADTSELDKMQEMNDNLKESFTKCKDKLTDCKIDQVKSFLEEQIKLTGLMQDAERLALQMKGEKTYSLVIFSISITGLILIYILAIPVYRKPSKVF